MATSRHPEGTDAGHVGVIDVDRAIARLASRQRGLVTREQALEVGVPLGALNHRLQSGALVAIEKCVYKQPEAPETWEVRALAACFSRGRGVVLSHGSAARLLGLHTDDWPESRIEVTVSMTRKPRPTSEVLVHRARQLDSKDRGSFAGLPITLVPRTVLDMAAQLSSSAVERLVDGALLSNRTTTALLSSALERSGRRGLTGVTAVRRALEPWLGRAVESHAEARVLRVLLRQGFAAPVAQYVVKDEQGFVARLDFAWPDRRLALEVDGFEPHAGPRKFVGDRHRWNRLKAAGWSVVATTQAEALNDSAALFEVLRRYLESGGTHSADRQNVSQHVDQDRRDARCPQNAGRPVTPRPSA